MEAFLDTMRYISLVVALMEACDVTKNGRHLGFYQALEIRKKRIEFIFVLRWTCKITHKEVRFFILSQTLL